MKDIIQTTVVSLAAVFIVLIVCHAVIEVNKPTKQELEIQALDVEENLSQLKSSAEARETILRIEERADKLDSLMQNTRYSLMED